MLGLDDVFRRRQDVGSLILLQDDVLVDAAANLDRVLPRLPKDKVGSEGHQNAQQQGQFGLDCHLSVFLAAYLAERFLLGRGTDLVD